VDLRTRTSLFCGVLGLAIAVSILLRGRPMRPQYLLAAFAANIGLWYLAQWLYHFNRADIWAQFTVFLAVLLPQFALHLFETIVVPEKRSKLPRWALVAGIPMLVLAVSPIHRHALVRTAVFVYVFGLLAAGLWALALRGEASGSRAIQRRVRVLVAIGAAATGASLADFLWFIGAPLPPVGAVLSIVFVFALAESLSRQRLVDLYDILTQLLSATLLAFGLAGIFYVFVVLFGGFETMYLGAILAAIVILLLFQPLREQVERYIHRAFFRERADLDRAVVNARGGLTHVLELDEVGHVVITALEASRRATGAALYLREPAGEDYELVLSFGPRAASRIDTATARPLIERLSMSSSLLLEEVSHEVLDRRRRGWTQEAEAIERVLVAARALGPFHSAVCLSVHGETHELLGILLVMDDRVRDAFSPEDVSLLESLAVQLAVAVENSRQYRRLQERDRLAALGQMAAGLAHEVKNPLGAIKGAAQLLNEPTADSRLEPSEREFVQIILEEVERLDRVVGSVLDYARPSKGNPSVVDVNEVVKGTLRVVASERTVPHVQTVLGKDLREVQADAEQLRQVLINLVRNAVQATAGYGTVTVTTRTRRPPVLGAATDGKSGWVEISVQDDGPGMAPNVYKNLFVPFFTTKESGTGLGLAISQRIVEDMGGRIEVNSQPGSGSTFTLVLPAARDRFPQTCSPRDPEPAADPPMAEAAADADGQTG
jgi:signal transduction histidine kinase